MAKRSHCDCCRHAGVQRWSPRAGATWEGYQCWVGLPAGCMVGWKPRQRIQPEWTGLARLVLRARSEHMVLCRLMEKHRNVALQCWVNWVEGEFFVFVSLKIPYNSSIARESYTKSLLFDIHLKISQKSPLLTQVLFKVLPLCWNSE